jgi:hypothetical protein
MNRTQSEIFNPGIGATGNLSLRVSAATLAKVIFEYPGNGELMLALERKATLHKAKTGRLVEVKSQPFGGAIRIQNLSMLHDVIGDFHFDSHHSRAEQDFRIFIRPSDWETVREFCVQHFSRVDDLILETSPGRELAEEFFDALKINLKPEQYIYKPVATVVENDPAPTENIHAQGVLTVRVYRIFEVRIVDSSLTDILITNSESLSHQTLCALALEDVKNNGKGRANAILALPLKHITDHYLSISPEKRNAPVLFDNNRLDETVSLVLEDIPVPKYQRL